MVLESLILSGVSGRIVLKQSENSMAYRSANWEKLSLEVMSQQCLQGEAEKAKCALQEAVLQISQ
jgi:hypothetical protein